MSGTSETLTIIDGVSAGLVSNPVQIETLGIVGIFGVEHWRDGELLHAETFRNVVTDQGKKAILDTFLGLAAAYAAIRIGLHTTVGSSTSVYATPTPQVEFTGYSGNRGTPTFSAASGAGTVTKATSAAVAFSITAAGPSTITGAFACLGTTANLNTPGDTATASAILFSSGSFGSSRSVIAGDTLNVTYQLSI